MKTDVNTALDKVLSSNAKMEASHKIFMREFEKVMNILQSLMQI
jgi:hypothetical protein